MWRVSKSADPDQTLRRRRGDWSGSTLLENMSECAFSHAAGHIVNVKAGVPPLHGQLSL